MKIKYKDEITIEIEEKNFINSFNSILPSRGLIIEINEIKIRVDYV